MGLFRRKVTIPPTGHAGDDQLLEEIARHSNLGRPRHWVHYLYVADEDAAKSAAGQVAGAGWDLQTVDLAVDGETWVVVAERHDAIVSPEAVRSAREFFEGLAASLPGGDYDGWEASV